MLICAWTTMVPFSGMYDEPYSMLNHYISELGDRRFSEFAPVFNYGLIVSSALLTLFGLGFASLFQGWQRVVIALLGLLTGISCLMVGAIPEDNLRPHILVAMIFFHSALALVFFNTAITLFSKQPVLPKWTVGIGVITAIFFASFVISPSEVLRSWIANPKAFVRPDVWIQPILEWGCFYSILAWLMVAAWLMLRGRLRVQRIGSR